MSQLRRLLGYLGPYRRDMVIGAALVLAETCFELLIPVLMADLIDVGVANRDMDYILSKGVQMGVCALLSLSTGLLYARFAARAAYGWGARIREAQFEKIQRYAFSNLDHFETSSLVTRMTTDVTVLQNAVNGGFRPLIRSPVMLLMGVGLSFWMNARLALVFLVGAPVLGCILFAIVGKVSPLYSRLQQAVDHVNNVVQEGLAAIRAVKAFVREEYQAEKFDQVNCALRDTSQNTFRWAVLNTALSGRHVHLRGAHHVVRRQYDPGGRPSGGRADGLSQLRVPGDELHDDDLQCLSAADPVPGQRRPHRKGAG